jgi:hypothetical protein
MIDIVDEKNTNLFSININLLVQMYMLCFIIAVDAALELKWFFY